MKPYGTHKTNKISLNSTYYTNTIECFNDYKICSSQMDLCQANINIRYLLFLRSINGNNNNHNFYLYKNNNAM